MSGTKVVSGPILIRTDFGPGWPVANMKNIT